MLKGKKFIPKQIERKKVFLNKRKYQMFTVNMFFKNTMKHL